MNKNKNMKQIKLGFPGREWRNQTVELFKRAGYRPNLEETLFRVDINDPQFKCFLARTEEIAEYVEKGILDAGITQSIRLSEQGIKNIIKVSEFDYGNNVWWKTKVVLAVPFDSKVKSIKDLKGKKILTRVLNTTKEYFKKNKIEAKIEWVNRPTETKVPIFGDAVVEFTNTGNALRANNLRIIDVLTETVPTLIANQNAWQDKKKREKIEDLGLLLSGARIAQDYAGLMLHASNDMMEEVLGVLPSLKKPTVTHLRGENWFDVFTVAEKEKIREIIPKLKKIGCTDIIEFPLKKLIV